MGFYRMSFLVLKSLFSEPATRLYPARVGVNSKSGTRGSIALDAPRCTLCGSCQRRCPTFAIVVERKEGRWTINRLRCISCNYCVEVCPAKCLSMLPQYSSPTVTRDRDVFPVPRREKVEKAEKEAGAT